MIRRQTESPAAKPSLIVRLAAGPNTRYFEGSRYFFTQAFVASSHFISFVFSQSALVFGASAANAGAETASSRPAIIAVLKILAGRGFSSFD